MRDSSHHGNSTMLSDLLILTLGVLVLNIMSAPVQGVLEEERIVPDASATSSRETVAFHIVARSSFDDELALSLDGKPITYPDLEHTLSDRGPIPDGQKALIELDSGLTYGEASRIKALLHEHNLPFIERRQTPASKR